MTGRFPELKLIQKKRIVRKGVRKMNEDHQKFQKVQREDRATYLGGAKSPKESPMADTKYNNKNDTDKSVGAGE
jgi:hypothetical protein